VPVPKGNCAKKGGETLKSNSEIRKSAREQLSGRWLIAVLVFFVYFLIVEASSFTVIGLFILYGPLNLGIAIFVMNTQRWEQAEFGDLFAGFKRFGVAFRLEILQCIFISLWSLLLIVPGIIKMFSYSMAFYILRDDPEIGALEAIAQSKRMMSGYKGKLFGLVMSFTGWFFLCFLTAGIGFFWLMPYVNVSMANFYEELTNKIDRELRSNALYMNYPDI
jgi:uncharacterized membrane protein